MRVLARASAGVKDAASLCLFMAEEPAGNPRVMYSHRSFNVIRTPTCGHPSRHHLSRGMLCISDLLRFEAGAPVFNFRS